MSSLAGEVFDLIVCPANSRNPRNTEADIIELAGGRLLLAYTKFYHYESHDMAPPSRSTMANLDISVGSYTRTLTYVKPMFTAQTE